MGNNVLAKTSATSAWDAAARSLEGLRGDGSFFFKVIPGTFQIMIGLSGRAVSADKSLLKHAILTGSAEYPSVYELGVERAATVGSVTTSATEYELRRVGTLVTYHQDGVLLYTSTAPSVGDVWLTTCMYQEGDGVQDPRVVAAAGGELFLDDLTVTNESLTGEAIGVTDFSVFERLALVITGRAVGDATITVGEIMRAALRGVSIGSTSMTLVSDEVLTLSLVAVGRGAIKAIGYGQETLALNLENGGTTRYEGFDFNSYAKIGPSYFGCKADGIYQLDGDTDAGAPIRSMVSFGKQSFGTSALKRITNAYVGVSGQGRLFLKVLAEGREYTYAQRGYDEHLQVQRFDTGKGMRVSWLEFELYNADGEDFELASVEFAVVPMNRRI